MCLKKSMESKKLKFNWNIGKITKQQWILLLLVGLILATIALPVTDSRKEEQTSGSLFGNGQEEEQTQKERLQSQLEDILSQVEGVGQAKVLLTFEEEDSSAFYTREDARRVAGVLIVAQGASDSTVERKIQQAVMALFQIEAHKIKVMKMK